MAAGTVTDGGLATATAIGIGISLAAALAAGIAAGLGLGVATAVALDLALAAGMALTTAVALAPTAESGLEGCGSSNPPIGVARWAPVSAWRTALLTGDCCSTQPGRQRALLELFRGSPPHP